MRKIFNGVHYPYTKLSKHGCKVCGKKIKARLILIKETIPRYCYRHFIKPGEALVDTD
jgi:hypothetical protein|tara:strand:- start:746 stop:919 length:174 start_codon:yes stop_codon:yes gene_type:complete